MASTQKIPIKNKCPKCNNRKLIVNHTKSKRTCKNCGHEIDSGYLQDAPKVINENGEQKITTGPPTNLLRHDKGLSNSLSNKDRDYRGNNISPKKKTLFRRLRKSQRRLKNNTERNLLTAFRIMKSVSSELGIPKPLQERAAKIYRKAQEEDIVKISTIRLVVLACLYIVSRQEKLPRKFEEIAEVGGETKRRVYNAYLKITRNLDDLEIPQVDIVPFVTRGLEDLEAENGFREKTLEITRKVKDSLTLQGKNPSSIAAGIVYKAAEETDRRFKQMEVAEAFGVTSVTVRSLCEKVEENLGE